MHSPLKLQECVFILAAKNHNPTLLNPDFLKYSGVVPETWELARQPIVLEQVAQVVYTNGVSITAQGERILFSEVIADKSLQTLDIVKIAHNYTRVLANVEYQGVAFTCRGHVAFDTEKAAQEYVNKTLLQPGSWMEIGQTPVRANLNLGFTLENRLFNLNIAQAGMRSPDEQVTPVVIFTGSFEYMVEGGRENRIAQLHHALDQWQADLTTYQENVNQRFLKLVELPQAVSALPTPELATINTGIFPALT